MLITLFNEIPDHRRAQARQYDLGHVLLFTVLAIISGADSYRKVNTFISTHFETLKERFQLTWQKTPAYSTIRQIIQGVNPKALEKTFRAHAQAITGSDPREYKLISLDSKVVRGSFDHFKDQKAIQAFSALLQAEQIILAHEEIVNHKTNEIPVAQKLIKELGLEGCLFTLDALHCQKKRLKQPKKRAMKRSSK